MKRIPVTIKIKVRARRAGSHSITPEVAYVWREGSRFAVGKARKSDDGYSAWHIGSGLHVNSVFPPRGIHTLAPALETFKAWETEIPDEDWAPFDKVAFGDYLVPGPDTTRVANLMRQIAARVAP